MSNQGLLMCRHLPRRILSPLVTLQHPHARAHGAECLPLPRRLHAIVDDCAIPAERENLVVAHGVRLPWLKVVGPQRVVDTGCGRRSEDPPAGEDHDRVAREDGD